MLYFFAILSKNVLIYIHEPLKNYYTKINYYLKKNTQFHVNFNDKI